MTQSSMDPMLRATLEAEERHFWFRGLRRFLAPLLEEAAAGVSQPAILDCGCGTGANLALLEQFGQTTGVDLSRLGVQTTRARGYTRTARASVASLPFVNEAFDIVTSLDVLYCLPDDDERAALQEMGRVLKPGGAAIINVAALDVLTGNHSVLVREVRRYTASRLRTKLEASGFEVARLTYTNALLFPLVLGTRALERIAGLKTPADVEARITVPAWPLNAMLERLLALEARMVRRIDMPVGSSLLCLARRPR